MSLPKTTMPVTSNLIAHMHVLIFDDDTRHRSLTRQTLAHLGVTRVRDASVSDDLDFRGSLYSADLILSEIEFRCGSGLSLLRAVRMGRIGGIHRDIPFAFVASSTSTRTISEAALLNAQGYLLKPVAVDRMRTILLRSLRTGRPSVADSKPGRALFRSSVPLT